MTKSKKYVSKKDKRSKRVSKRNGKRMNKISKRIGKRVKRLQRGGAWWENLTGTRKVDIKNPEIYTKRKFTTTQFNNDKCYDILNENHYSSPYFQKCNNMLAYIVENSDETKIDKLEKDLHINNYTDVTSYSKNYCTDFNKDKNGKLPFYPKNEKFCKKINLLSLSSLFPNYIVEVYPNGFTLNNTYNLTEIFDRSIKTMIHNSNADIFTDNKIQLQRINVNTYDDICTNTITDNIIFKTTIEAIAQDIVRSSGLMIDNEKITSNEWVQNIFKNPEPLDISEYDKRIIQICRNMVVKVNNNIEMPFEYFMNNIISIKKNMYDILVFFYFVFKRPESNDLCNIFTEKSSGILYNCKPVNINKVDKTEIPINANDMSSNSATSDDKIQIVIKLEDDIKINVLCILESHILNFEQVTAGQTAFPRLITKYNFDSSSDYITFENKIILPDRLTLLEFINQLLPTNSLPGNPTNSPKVNEPNATAPPGTFRWFNLLKFRGGNKSKKRKQKRTKKRKH
jgi:hypothetical protein